ncbi:hypothetical protein BAL199_08908 [alpha proteobacterium BAL199]|nr:hypothetical protein BAL199_08908 [alpha proteobacterium BAL199]
MRWQPDLGKHIRRPAEEFGLSQRFIADDLAAIVWSIAADLAFDVRAWCLETIRSGRSCERRNPDAMLPD